MRLSCSCISIRALGEFYMRFAKGHGTHNGPSSFGQHDHDDHGHGQNHSHHDFGFDGFLGNFLNHYFRPQHNDYWPGNSSGHSSGPAPHHPHQPAVAYRSADGSGNNKFDTTLAAGTEFGRIGEAHFADGISSRATATTRAPFQTLWPAHAAGVANPKGVSAFMYAWGQFIDHDIQRVPRRHHRLRFRARTSTPKSARAAATPSCRSATTGSN